MANLMKVRIDLSCPICGRAFSATLGDVQAHRVVRCSAGHPVQLREEGDNLRRADQKLDRAWRNLQRSLQRLGHR